MKQARGPRGLGVALSKATRRLFRRRGFAQAAVLTQWPAIVGEELAAHCVPERVTFPMAAGDGGTLHLRVAGGLATELQHLEPLVVERVNTYFGYHAIARLALKQGPLPPPRAQPVRRRLAPPGWRDAALAREVADTGDDRLRAALLALGREVAWEEGAEDTREE